MEKDFANIINERIRMDANDALEAAKTQIANLSIDLELAHCQLKIVTEYAKELYQENLDLKAAKEPDDIETFSKEEGTESNE